MRGAWRHRVVWVADAIGMHATVEVDARKAVAMRFKDSLNLEGIGNVRGAFIVDHQVIAFGVLRVTQNGQRRMSAGVIRVDLIDNNIGAFLQAFLENVLLFGVIMTTTSGD